MRKIILILVVAILGIGGGCNKAPSPKKSRTTLPVTVIKVTDEKTEGPTREELEAACSVKERGIYVGHGFSVRVSCMSWSPVQDDARKYISSFFPYDSFRGTFYFRDGEARHAGGFSPKPLTDVHRRMLNALEEAEDVRRITFAEGSINIEKHQNAKWDDVEPDVLFALVSSIFEPQQHTCKACKLCEAHFTESSVKSATEIIAVETK